MKEPNETSPHRPFLARAFGTLMRAAHSEGFNKAHGEAMEAAFEDLYEEARRRGLLALTALFLREGRGLAQAAFQEWKAEREELMELKGREGWASASDSWYRNALRDTGHAMRVIRKHRGHSSVVVLTLAVGIASTASVFTVVNAVLFRPLPYQEAERLAIVWSLEDANTAPSAMTVAPSDFLDWREQSRAFQGLAAHNLWFPVLSGGDGGAQTILGGVVTPNLFEVLGVRPVLGRTFREDEALGGGSRVTVLSHGLWRTRYGGDPGILGTTVRLNGNAYEVVGVLPPDYRHPDPHRPLTETQLFAPFNTTEIRMSPSLRVVKTYRLPPS